MLSGSDLCWTDMGPGSQPNRQVRPALIVGGLQPYHALFQLQLHPYKAGNQSQEFRIL